MDNDDADLIALIDGELDEPLADALRKRIADDSRLRARYEILREQHGALSGALDGLLRRAPVARLKAFIPPDAPTRGAGFSARFSWRQLAAGLLVGFALAAAALSLVNSHRGTRDDWRSAVMNYMALYTNETFARIPKNQDARTLELGAVGAQVGAKLTPESVALPGLDLKTAFILAYDEKPLGEVVQVDPSGAPVLFCVIANGAADAPLKSERREGLSLASWSRGGKGYLVIAGLPEAQVTGYARALEARF